MRPERTWRALHVYYRAPQDRLLIEGVAPLLDRLAGDGSLDRFFFLRYWLGGLHVRLRLHLPADGADRIAAEVATALCGYVARHPSDVPVDPDRQRAALAALAALEHEPAERRLVPDNTVLAEPYRPELAKYGGAGGVARAEVVFHASSRYVLQVLDRLTRGGDRLVLAFTGFVRALRAVGMSPPRQVVFLDRYHRFWAPYAPDTTDWPRRYQTQAAVLRTAVEHAWSSDAAPLEADWLTALAGLLARVEEDPRLLDAVTAAGPLPAADRRAYLLLNLLHTHHNRLGVSPAHEAYLAFLAGRAVRDLCGQPAPVPDPSGQPRHGKG